LTEFWRNLMTIATKKIRKSGNQRLVQNSFVHEIWWLVKTCWNGLVTEWSKFHTWLIWVNPVLLTSKFWWKRLLLLSVFDRPICCYCHQLTDCFGAMVSHWQTTMLLLSSTDRLFWHYDQPLTDHYVAIVIWLW